MDESGHIIVEEILLDKQENSFLQRMNTRRKENPETCFCDVSFNVEGKEFHCHKFVMASASEYFEKMLNGSYTEGTSCHNIRLQNVEIETWEEILTAIYTTRIHLNLHNAYFVLRASNMFSLTDIFNATANYIIKTPDIDYLIETCVLAEHLKKDDLYKKCVESIASDLNDLSKTDAFAEKITFDIFKDILSHVKIIESETSLFQIIKKFYSFGKCTQHQVYLLLNCAKIKHGYFNRQMMVEYVTNSDVLAPENSGVDVNYKVCLNTVNIKTGAKGWGIWQSKHGLDDFEVICQLNSNAGYRKVAKIGNSHYYCFEYDLKLGRNFFYQIQNNKKNFLNLPPSIHPKNSCFDIEALGNFIYLITEFGELFQYNCETNNWTLLSQICRHKFKPYKFNYYDRYTEKMKTGLINSTPKLVPSQNILFLVDDLKISRVCPNEMELLQNVSSRYQLPCLSRNSAVCCYRNHLIISGGLNQNAELLNEVISYDRVARKWLKLADMNMGRANHSLTCDDRFLYAIENKAMIFNEKYDFNSRKWISIPSLPQRLRITNHETEFDLATGDLFNCSIVTGNGG